MGRTKLSVNLNKVALLRNQREVGYPSVTEIGRLVLDAGAHGLTIHPRPDERHIRRSDAYELNALLKADAYDGVEFNIEGYPTDDFISLVLELRPTQATLVPDAPDQRTSDHGWRFSEQGALLAPVVQRLRDMGTRVALFVDPELDAIAGAVAAGADRVELYTEPYAMAYNNQQFAEVLGDYAACAVEASRLGLGVNAGHDLNLENLPAFKAAIPSLAEVSIGHAITADALCMGFPSAIRSYLDALSMKTP